MCSYNKIRGTWSCENSETLGRDLKKRLGFKGWVMSDWGATHSSSINAGLDQAAATSQPALMTPSLSRPLAPSPPRSLALAPRQRHESMPAPLHTVP